MEWYYWLILGVLIAFTIFVWTRAMKSSRERRKRIEKEEARLKYEFELRRDFKELTSEKIESTSNDRLLSGVCTNIQIPLEKHDDMISAFDLLPIQKQYVYTLNFFGEDTKNYLSEFFKCNGRPLITLAPLALREIGMDDIAELSEKMLPMCDDDNEEVSVDAEYRDKLDTDFMKEFDRSRFYELAAKYIRNNKDIFLSQEM